MKSATTPRPRGRPRSFDREQALERALDVFWEKGYEATSVADLTAAMGINPPSLYAAFGDKERLFCEALERYHGVQRASVDACLEGATAREGVERILAGLADQYSCAEHRGCMMVMAATTCADASQFVKTKLARTASGMRARFKGRMDRAVAEGELAAATDVDALVDYYTAVFQGMALQARDGASRKSLLATAEMAMRAWPESKSKHARSVGTRKVRSVA
jgi:AcrR family transcriptional regulator